jgi:ribosomal protein S18 acetylase RimI-like enzyme
VSTEPLFTLRHRERLCIDDAGAIWRLQQSAYAVEAALIGCDDFPLLRESVADLLAAQESFLLSYYDNDLAGALSYATNEMGCLICRLVVAPEYFRRGIGRRMLHNLLVKTDPALPCRVVTAQANIPAIALYQSFGFRPGSAFASRECIDLVQLTRRAHFAA